MNDPQLLTSLVQPELFGPVLLQAENGGLVEVALTAFDTVFTPIGLLLIALGAILGLVMGAIPGLGGPVAIALLIPLTFHLKTEHAFMIMAATLGGVAFGGSITAILLNIPGDAPNAATLLDGYPLTKQGRGGEAVTASAISSALGATIGIVLFVILIPFVRPIVLSFWSPELFWLAIFGLAVLATVTRGSVLTDLIAGTFGLVLAFHGLNAVTGSARFTWDTTYLLDGFTLIPVIIGLFAIAEMIKLVSEGRPITEKGIADGGIVDGFRSVANSKWTVVRGSIIGWFIGVVPGVGGTVANFVAYYQEMQWSNDPDSFGKGNIKGVIASEAANDAKDGGTMLPTLALGIPGSASTAVLLGAFLVHGIQPGPVLFDQHVNLIFVILFALLISNLITSSIGLLLANKLVTVTRTPTEVLAPVVLFISFVGAFMFRNNFGDIAIAGLFGVFGYLMIRFGMSRIILIIALILGPVAEANFHRSLQFSSGDYGVFYSRPISVVLIALIVVILLLPVVQDKLRRST
ncbi:tripartite tricarboxylate transporter permease [Haloferax sp. DFSO52]|uniref:tripartite tricarboxylate transporter permease n=1 Tax=Haloferax sp. DFSO52 TaxID=3388505 RepID=UPI003A868F8A